MSEAWIVDACRTGRGIGKAPKGALSSLHPQQLAAAALAALAERAQLDTRDIDDVIWGTSMQSGTAAGDLGRMAALDAGYHPLVSAVTIDRFCGSGLSAVNLAAGMIRSGLEDVVVAGGSEQMSAYPVNTSTRDLPFMDRGNTRLRARYPQSHQGVAADTIATLNRIDRLTVDTYAAQSQRRAAVAIAEGRFKKSLIPVYSPDGTLLLDHDEHPRPGTTVESLGRLRPSFDEMADVAMDADGDTFRGMILREYPGLRIDHVHHAGNSSGVVDGAAALLLTSEDYATSHGLRPRARVVAIANAGGDPTLMLDAPSTAARKVLRNAGLTLDQIDLFEVNEAFAAIPEKFARDLGVDRERLNVNGGAIALGHPIGATGAILVGTALDELERRDGRYALITMCTGGGMAPAAIIERIA
jgi:acetyl-CoA C-acetyltransferase